MNGAPYRDAPPALTPASGERVSRVGLLLGCVQREVFGDVNTATARVLAADGFEVVSPAAQGCCGALAIHAAVVDVRQLDAGKALGTQQLRHRRAHRAEAEDGNARCSLCPCGCLGHG